MKARSLTLCLFFTALGTIPVFGQADAKPAAAKADGSGQLEQRRQEMLRRFDVNADGKLDEAEKAAMKEARKKPAAVRGSGDIGGLSGTGEPAGAGDRYLREMMKRYDKDGDRKLDETELAELIKNRNAAGPGAPGARLREQMVKLFDKNGDGQLDPEERAAAEQFRVDQVKRHDKDGDGQLDAEERAEAMRAFLADHPELATPGR